MTNDLDAALALSRFGLGARDGSLAAIGSDPRGALRQEVTGRALAMPAGPELKSSPELMVDLFAFLKERKLERERKNEKATPQDAAGRPMSRRQMMTGGQNTAAVSPGAAAMANRPQLVFLAEVEARFNGTMREPAIGFPERLAHVLGQPLRRLGRQGPGGARHSPAPSSARRSGRTCSAASRTCCWRSRRHPAMLLYLDNAQSIGPDTPRRRSARKRGLNENLAREILELHTLGVDGGYTPGATSPRSPRIITGWSIGAAEGARLPASPAPSCSIANAHEPGDADAARRRAIPTTACSRARRRCATSPAIRRPRGTSRSSSRAISSPTCRRRRWSRGWPRPSPRTRGDLSAVVSRADRVRRGVDPAAGQDALAARVRRRAAARQRREAQAAADRAARSNALGQPHLESARPERLFRQGRCLGVVRRRWRPASTSPDLVAGATPGSDDPRRLRPRHPGLADVAADRPGDGARREPRSRPVARLSVARVPEALTMSPLITPSAATSRRPRRRRRPLLLGLHAALRASRRRARSAARRHHPARRARRAGRRAADRRSATTRACAGRSPSTRRPEHGAATRRLLRPASGDAELRAALRRQAGGDRPRRRHRLSRPLAFRRPGRARKRLPGAGHADRLAQPRCSPACPRASAARRERGRWRSAPTRRW